MAVSLLSIGHSWSDSPLKERKQADVCMPTFRAKPDRRQSKPADRRRISRGGRRSADPSPTKSECLWTLVTGDHTYTCGLHVYGGMWNVWILKDGTVVAARDGFPIRAQSAEWSKRMRKQLG
jgi:hypothetical protein